MSAPETLPTPTPLPEAHSAVSELDQPLQELREWGTKITDEYLGVPGGRDTYEPHIPERVPLSNEHDFDLAVEGAIDAGRSFADRSTSKKQYQAGIREAVEPIDNEDGANLMAQATVEGRELQKGATSKNLEGVAPT